MELQNLVGLTYARLVNGELYDFYVLNRKKGESYEHFNISRKTVEITPSPGEFKFLKKLGICCALTGKDRTIIKIYGCDTDKERFKRVNVRSNHDDILNVGRKLC